VTLVSDLGTIVVLIDTAPALAIAGREVNFLSVVSAMDGLLDLLKFGEVGEDRASSINFDQMLPENRAERFWG
jgi:hypothetical protein